MTEPIDIPALLEQAERWIAKPMPSPAIRLVRQLASALRRVSAERHLYTDAYQRLSDAANTLEHQRNAAEAALQRAREVADTAVDLMHVQEDYARIPSPVSMDDHGQMQSRFLRAREALVAAVAAYLASRATEDEG